jgi:rubrerythrin
MSKHIICPVCWHDDTYVSLASDTEIIHDDPYLMSYNNYYKKWVCNHCNLKLTPREAFLLLDAVLRVSDPNSDSFNGITFLDARKALN